MESRGEKSMETLSKEERIKFLKTLETDREFRYAIAGLIGIREILERLDKIEKSMERLWENQNRLWEGQERLWEGQKKLWEEVKELREGQNKLWEEVKGLRINFRQLGKAVGMTLDHYTAAFLERILLERGYPEERVDIRVDIKLQYKGEILEVDLLNDDPLVVGEVTTHIKSAEEVEKEVDKLLERVELVEKMYGRGVELKVIAVANLERGATETLRELTDRHGILVITGREIEAP